MWDWTLWYYFTAEWRDHSVSGVAGSLSDILGLAQSSSGVDIRCQS